jgi:hypothetical protein
VQKAYARKKTKQFFEESSTLISKVLECFDKNPSGGVVLHTCVNTVGTANSEVGWPCHLLMRYLLIQSRRERNSKDEQIRKVVDDRSWSC